MSPSEHTGLFNLAIATIFAREFLEGSIIVINYRSIILKNEEWSAERKNESLRTVTVAACIATFVAILVVIAIAVPLGILGHELDDRTVEIVEGTSKLVATIFILHFSLKIPVWLGVYEKVPLCGLKKMIKVYCCGKQESIAEKEEEDSLTTLTLGEIRFNVMWNLWREVAECGVFLIPFFLESGARAIPLSGLVGIIAAILLAAAIYQANHRMTSNGWLACFMAGMMLLLSVGLLVGAVSEFQEVVGHASAGEESEDSEDGGDFVYQAKNKFWADDRFPFVLLKPFGYTDKRTVAQICTFWLYLAFGLSLHWVMYYRTNQVRALRRERSGRLSKGTSVDDEVQEQYPDDEPEDVEAPKQESGKVPETVAVASK